MKLNLLTPWLSLDPVRLAHPIPPCVTNPSSRCSIGLDMIMWADMVYYPEGNGTAFKGTELYSWSNQDTGRPSYSSFLLWFGLCFVVIKSLSEGKKRVTERDKDSERHREIETERKTDTQRHREKRQPSSWLPARPRVLAHVPLEVTLAPHKGVRRMGLAGHSWKPELRFPRPQCNPHCSRDLWERCPEHGLLEAQTAGFVKFQQTLHCGFL